MYSERLKKHFNKIENGYQFEDGVFYSDREAEILKTKTEEAKKAIHLVKGVFEESEVIS